MSVPLVDCDDRLRAETLKAISDGLQCSICQGLLQDPCMHDKCEQLWCRACISRWLSRESSCPTCRGVLHTPLLRPAHRIIRQQLEVLPVPCPHRDDGCELMLTRAALAEHVGMCPKAVVACPNMGCEVAAMPRERMVEHGPTCQYRPVDCERCGARVRAAALEHHVNRVCPEETVSCTHNGGCDARLKRKAMDEHVGTSCKRAAIPCPVAGCAERVLRGTLDDHLAASVQGHLAALSREVASLRSELARQQDKHRRELQELRTATSVLRNRLDEQGREAGGRAAALPAAWGVAALGAQQEGEGGDVAQARVPAPTPRRPIQTTRRTVPPPQTARYIFGRAAPAAVGVAEPAVPADVAQAQAAARPLRRFLRPLSARGGSPGPAARRASPPLHVRFEGDGSDSDAANGHELLRPVRLWRRRGLRWIDDDAIGFEDNDEDEAEGEGEDGVDVGDGVVVMSGDEGEEDFSDEISEDDSDDDDDTDDDNEEDEDE